MAPEEADPPPSVAAADAAPKPAPAEPLNLAAGPHEADHEMAQGEVTEQQLAESNEPQFQQALADKQAAAAHATAAPAQCLAAGLSVNPCRLHREDGLVHDTHGMDRLLGAQGHRTQATHTLGPAARECGVGTPPCS